MKQIALFDSWVWVELLRNPGFIEHIEAHYSSYGLIVSTINMHEIYRKAMLERPDIADFLIDTIIYNCNVIPLTITLAIRAAEFRKKYKLGMADSMVLATAEQEGAVIVTGDKDFNPVEEVKVDLI